MEETFRSGDRFEVRESFVASLVGLRGTIVAVNFSTGRVMIAIDRTGQRINFRRAQLQRLQEA